MQIDKELTKRILSKAKTAGADEAEVFINFNKHLKIDVMGQKIEALDNVEDGGLAIRVIKGGKMGFAYTADLENDVLDEVVAQAIENSKPLTADKANCFAMPDASIKQMALVDKDIKDTDILAKKLLAMEIESVAKAYDPRIKKIEKISYFDTASSTYIANTNGINVNYEKTICGAMADVIALDNNQMETGSWISYRTKYKDINPKEVGTIAAKRAVQMLGAKSMQSGRASVIFTPYAAVSLISALIPAFSADFAQKGKSIFINSIDKPIASTKFTLIDSGVMPGAPGTVPFDDEGVLSKENYLIKDGYLRSFLYNSYTAKKAGKPSTSNGFRDSFKSLPEILPSNMYVKPGSKGQAELIDKMNKGFLIDTIMGAHTINPISGDFSIGFSGQFVENGKISRPVRGMTIAGNILEILNHIDDVGSDIDFFPHGGNCGSPSLLIANLSISGS
jgi:PmbA protein